MTRRVPCNADIFKGWVCVAWHVHTRDRKWQINPLNISASHKTRRVFPLYLSHMNTSCHTYKHFEYVGIAQNTPSHDTTCHAFTHMHALCHTSECFTSHTWMFHVTRKKIFTTVLQQGTKHKYICMHIYYSRHEHDMSRKDLCHITHINTFNMYIYIYIYIYICTYIYVYIYIY